MKLSAFVDGVTILRRYFDNADGYHLGAAHDQIFIYATNRPVSPEDVAALRKLGWFQPDADEDDDGDWQYDPEAGWSAFV